MLLSPISQSKYPYIREHLLFPPKIARLENTKLTKCHFLSHGEQLRFSEMLVSRMIVSLKRWIWNDMFLRSPFLVMLSPYLRLCECVCVWEERCIRMYACIWIYVSGSLESWRPVLCNTPQPNQLKFDFNLCVTFLFGSACVCLSACWSMVFCAETCLHSSSCERLAALLPLFFTLLLYFFLFFLPFLAFLCLCGWTALSHIHRLPTPAVMMVTDREFTARKGEKDR